MWLFFVAFLSVALSAFSLAKLWQQSRRKRVAAATGALAHANGALVMRADLLKHMLDTAPVAIFLVDDLGKIQQANRHMHEMFGLSVDESLNGRDYRTLVHSTQRGHAHANLLALLSNTMPPVDEDRLYVRADQSQFWGHVTCRGLSNVAEGRQTVVGVLADISRHKLAQLTMQESEAQFRAAFMTIPDAVNISRYCDGLYLQVNDGFLQLLGWTREEALGKSSLEMNIWHNPDDRRRLRTALHETGCCENFEAIFVTRDGKQITGSMSAQLLQVQGQQCVLSVTRDMTEQKKAEDQIRKLSRVVEQNPNSVVIANNHAEIEYVNEAFARSCGYGREEVIGKNMRILKSGKTSQQTYIELWESMAQGQSWQGEFFNQRKDGSQYVESAIISPLRDPKGNITHYVSVQIDVTAQKHVLERINHLAYYDVLTGLPNRRLLMDQLHKVLAASTRHQRYGGLLFVDLDEFKTINETFGHASGDRLLRMVSRRLIACVRGCDMVVRIGGDEFVILLDDLSENAVEAAAQLKSLADKVLCSLEQDHQIDGVPYQNTASVGATLFARQTQTIEEILKHGELAMYQAKKDGRNTVCFFDPKMQAAVNSRVGLERDLREALAGQQFLLHYQAQVCFPNDLTGVEALIRWHHPQRGLVSPAEFIPIAESIGLITPIGRWVLETACVQLCVWALNPAMAQLTIAVNVSARQFHRPDFVQDVIDVLHRTGANPRRLKLELTESLLVADVEGVIAKMNALKEMGVGFSLDDFGTGFSSLSYLKRLPLDQLKIDRSFVKDILVDTNDMAIAKMVIALANSMGLSVIAEGVENEAQRDCLAQLGCLACQGYLYSKPLPLLEFEGLVTGVFAASTES